MVVIMGRNTKQQFFINISDTDNIVIESASKMMAHLWKSQNRKPSIIDLSKLIDFEHSTLFEGRYELLPIAENCIISIVDINTKKPFETNTQIENLLGFEYYIEGDLDILVGDYPKQKIGHSQSAISSFSHQSIQSRILKAGVDTKYIGIWVAPEFLVNEFDLNIKDLSPILQSMALLQRDIRTSYPISTKISNITSDIFNNDFSGNLKTKYITSKMNELLCYTVYNITRLSEALLSTSGLNRRKITVLQTIIPILETENSTPPTLQELSAIANTSISNLNKLFYSVYGISVAQYSLSFRMKSACALLKEGRLPITEIAYKVGYDNPSSFSRIYKKFFGHAPKEDLPVH